MGIVNVPDTDSFDLWRQKTNLLSLNVGDINRLIAPINIALTGTITSVDKTLIGSGTSFLTDLAVGSLVKDPVYGTERRIVSVSSDVVAETDEAFTPALTSGTNDKLILIDIISAINSYIASQRAVLIRAIAMS